jgi:hypothetical protein
VKIIGNVIRKKHPMNSYIFTSSEGFTYQPNSTSDVPDVENLQVIGYAAGENEQVAFQNLIKENSWLLNTSFSEIRCLQLEHLHYEKHMMTFDLKNSTKV